MANIIQVVINGSNLSAKAFAGAKKDVIAFESALNKTAIAFAGLAAAAAGSALVGMVKFTKEAINSADEIGKLAQKSGIAVEQFSALSYSAGLSEVSAESLKTATKKLSDEMVRLGRGNDSVIETILRTADEF